MENVITLDKLIGLLFCLPSSLLFFDENSKNTRNVLARTVMGTIFLVYGNNKSPDRILWLVVMQAGGDDKLIGRAKRAPHWGVQSKFRVIYIREYGSTLYVGFARAVSPTNTNFRLTFFTNPTSGGSL